MNRRDTEPKLRLDLVCLLLAILGVAIGGLGIYMLLCLKDALPGRELIRRWLATWGGPRAFFGVVVGLFLCSFVALRACWRRAFDED